MIDSGFTDSERVFEMYGQSPCQKEIVPVNHSAEPCVEDWRRYRNLSGNKGDFNTLQSLIERFNIPVKSGISETEAYKNIVLRGEKFRPEDSGGKFALKKPDDFEFLIYEHPAGALPVMVSSCREDFVNLYSLIGNRCEPVNLNSGINALIVSGFSNWERINRYREQWSASLSFFEKMRWPDEFKRVGREEPELFNDRLILLMRGVGYGGTNRAFTGIECTADEWMEYSLKIRAEHEFTHYVMKRVFGVMRHHVWDEIIADFMALVSTFRDFRSEWLLSCMGVNPDGGYRGDSRVMHYLKNESDLIVKSIVSRLPDIGKGLENLYRKKLSSKEWMSILLIVARMSFKEMIETGKS